MASTKPSNPKTASPSSTPAGRRSPKQNRSPDGRLPTHTEKPSAQQQQQHPKPKAAAKSSTTNTTNATTKSTTSNVNSPITPPTAGKRSSPAAKNPLDHLKPPSPSRRPERTLSTPTTNQERSSSKPASSATPHHPMPRPNNHLSKTALQQRVTKNSTAAGKSSPAGALFGRSKSLEKSKEVVAVPSAFVDMAYDSGASHADVALAVKEENDLLAHVDDDPKPEEQEHDDSEIITDAQEQAETSPDATALPNQVETEATIETNKEPVHGEEEAEAEAEEEAEAEAEAGVEEVKEETFQEAMPVEGSPKQHVAQATSVPAATTMEVKEPQRGTVAMKKEAQKNNDVIEEVKSKFLSKRKNKVLALVGAFETVMALQEPEVQQAQQQKKGKEVEENNDLK